jgi:hypothetical protein
VTRCPILGGVRSLGELTPIEWAVIAVVSVAAGVALAAVSAGWAVPLGLLVLALVVRLYLMRRGT